MIMYGIYNAETLEQLTNTVQHIHMKLVTFSIDKNRNLIVQFPVFIQLSTQQPLILYQIETVPVSIID